MGIMAPKTVPALIKKYNIRANKKLGQNFLKDSDVMDRLIDPLNLYPDEDVLEIGPGLGVITEKLSRQVLEVIAIEKDKKMLEVAQKEFAERKNIRFIEGDFTKLDLSTLLKPFHLPIKVFGNIPYYVSSTILFQLIENHPLFQCAVLTLQKEVANRLTASPGNKDYGILTILSQPYAVCEKLFDIEPGSFLPPPEVTSTAVKITFLKTSPYVIHKPKLFTKIVKTAFQQRRKTVRNALKVFLKNGRIKPWEVCYINPDERPECLTVKQYVDLANYLDTVLK